MPIPNTLHPSVDPSDRPKLLIVDDDESIRTQMKWALAKDYDVFLAEDRQRALELFAAERPAVVTLDLGLPPDSGGVKEGFLALEEILDQDTLAKVILITGHTEKEHALTGVGQGAYDYFCKPIQIDEVRVILKRAFYIYQLEQEHRKLQQQLDQEPFEGMVGTSLTIQKVFGMIRKVATTDASVLIVVESGVGKELVARAIHKQSAKKEGPYVAINCGAIPETLLESELFGHEKGAFTGAHMQRKGRIELAQGGTLFLDEIGEMSLPLQVKMLRFLQEHQIQRVGGREEIVVDIRVMAATNMDVKKALREGQFREDLYYRLGVVTIVVPPLRERAEDILLLAKILLNRYSAESRKRLTGFTKQAQIALKTYSWPGNIRELENRIRRAVIMAERPTLSPADLELSSRYAEPKSHKLLEAREFLEKEMIIQALRRHKGNLTRVSAELSISRPTLYERMQKLGMQRKGGGYRE